MTTSANYSPIGDSSQNCVKGKAVIVLQLMTFALIRSHVAFDCDEIARKPNSLAPRSQLKMIRSDKYLVRIGIKVGPAMRCAAHANFHLRLFDQVDQRPDQAKVPRKEN